MSSIIRFLTLSADANRKQLLASYFIVIFAITRSISAVVVDSSAIVAILLSMLALRQSYQIARWIYTLPANVWRPVMLLWLSTLALMLLHAALWMQEGAGYHPDGVLGIVVNAAIFIMLAIMLCRPQRIAEAR